MIKIKEIIPLKIRFLIKKKIRLPMRLFSDFLLGIRNVVKKKEIYQKKKNNLPIKVAIFLQYPEMWNSLKSIYEYMTTDKRFECVVLTIPKRDCFNGKAILLKNNEATVFCKKESIYYEELDLENPASILTDIDYVFVQRPYSDYLPQCLSLHNISKYSMICYVPYGYEFVKGVHMEYEYNDDFLNNMTYCFVESDETYEYVQERRKYEIDSGLKKLFNVGYPRFDSINRVNNPTKINRILWTPRWSLSEENDRSFFFDYYSVLMKYMKEHLDIYLIIRPHPLMFSNFIEKGRLSVKDVEEIKRNIHNMENVCLDINADYKETFDNSDLIISDFSSLIIEYFITNKPVVYCGGNISSFNKVGQSMSEGFYNVSDEKELLCILDSLLNNEDEKFDKRKKIANTLLNNTGNAGMKISEIIYHTK